MQGIKISLKKLGVDEVEMRKAAMGAIIIRVPGDKDRDKASKLATKLAGILDPSMVKIAAPLRMAELKIERIDVSVNKEELRHALALAAGCKKRRAASGGDRDSQGRTWDCMDKMPGSQCQEACPGKEGGGRVVVGDSNGHSQKTPSMLQVPGIGSRECDLHVNGG
jgi:hypothetical protein